jgi:uncharacterized delta-60 repeat protein
MGIQAMSNLITAAKTMRLLILSITLLGIGASTAQADDGALDPSFGSNGHVLTNINRYTDRAQKMLRYPDGRYLVLGNASNTGIYAEEIAMVRYLANGALDSSFGVSGKVKMAVTPTCNWYPSIRDAAFDSQFRIVVGLSVHCDGSALYSGAVMRFTNTGAPDSTFATNGFLRLDFGDLATWSQLGALLMLPDDSMIVGGSAVQMQQPNFITRAAMQKIASNGTAIGPARIMPPTAAGHQSRASLSATDNSSYWLETTSVGEQATVRKVDNDTLADVSSFGSAGTALLDPVATSGNTACVFGATPMQHRATSMLLFDNTIKVIGSAATTEGPINLPVDYVFFFSIDLAGSSASVRHGCLTPATERMAAEAAVADQLPYPAVYAAGRCRGGGCFTRFVPNPGDRASLIRDPNFNSGNPVLTGFLAPGGATRNASFYSLVRHGRQTVLAGTYIHEDPTMSFPSTDPQFAVARFGTTLFADGFE